MILIQIVAALLLVLGSLLLFQAVVALDGSTRPKPLPRQRFDTTDDARDQGLPRAA